MGYQHLQVHQAAHLGAVRPGLPHGGPGAGDADRAAAGDQAQVRVRAAAGAGAHQPLLQPGADPARPGGRLRRPQPEIPRAAGTGARGEAPDGSGGTFRIMESNC
ncbi:hypothetical protein llap_22516 [Limosa lapponica baueri]|uniref:Uncharacterized protein n=1 Tax=Limosa lapponica baueri TaxID=1758121 RepID=A0A2I0T051_LIMLA|nr:hypothetical protein llap_22516 [Limosa lapponica baueri]